VVVCANSKAKMREALICPSFSVFATSFVPLTSLRAHLSVSALCWFSILITLSPALLPSARFAGKLAICRRSFV
jgi:hypothetical protein